MAGFAYQPCDTTTGKPGGVGGRLAASVFFLFFLGMGSVFCVLLITALGRAASQRMWKSVPCKIVASEIRDRNDRDRPFTFAVSYTYEYGGQTCSGSVYQRDYKASAKYSEAQKIAQKYPVGLTISCYVNPAKPAEAVLKRDSLTVGLFIVIPLIFVYIGAGGLYFTWRPKREKTDSLAGTATQSVSRGRYAVPAFFAIFGLVGLGLLYPLGVKPIVGTIEARSWTATPCKVLRAEVQSHTSSDNDGTTSTTYSVYILYEYTVAGQTYKSDNYDFVNASSGGCDRKAKIVEQYRSAANPICYVNPKDPSQAVLKRGFSAALLVVLMPLFFMLFGFGGAYAVVRGTRRSVAVSETGATSSSISSMRVPTADSASVLQSTDSGPVVLKPAHSPFVKFIGAVLIASFWNGIVSVFVSQMIGGFHRDHPAWFLVIFLVPFELVGIVMIGFVIYQFLALFNPRATLELSAATIPLGGAAELRWNIWGWVRRIREFTVTLRGAEVVNYRDESSSGKNMDRMDGEAFYEMELCRTSNTGEIAAGNVGFVMPHDTMYSFEAPNNKIVWSLDIRGKIAWWPDVKESFKLTITPAKS